MKTETKDLLLESAKPLIEYLNNLPVSSKVFRPKVSFK